MLGGAGRLSTRQPARASWGARPPPAGQGTPSADRGLAGAPGGAGLPRLAKDDLGRGGRLIPCARYLADCVRPMGSTSPETHSRAAEHVVEQMNPSGARPTRLFLTPCGYPLKDSLPFIRAMAPYWKVS